MDNFKKYLPSKKFLYIIIVILILIAIFFAIKGIISLFTKGSSKNASKELTPMTVSSIIQKDGNDNGIADWEEYLWGLDPNKNGPENKEFITSKKKALTQSGDIEPVDDSKTITDNEILSREFFATIMSLQQTGTINKESIQSVSDAIGETIKATPIADIYTKKMITIKNDSQKANEDYLTAFEALVNKHKDEDIGSELTLISQGIGNNDPQALDAAKSVASAYRTFGSELIKIPVPYSISNTHIDLANNYEKTAQSIEGLTQIISDPIIGMRALIGYKEYSDALVSNLEKITEILQ